MLLDASGLQFTLCYCKRSCKESLQRWDCDGLLRWCMSTATPLPRWVQTQHTDLVLSCHVFTPISSCFPLSKLLLSVCVGYDVAVGTKHRSVVG